MCQNNNRLVHQIFISSEPETQSLRHIFRSSALSSVKKCSHSLIMIFTFNRHVENILIYLTLLERFEQVRWWGRYYIDNSKLWSKAPSDCGGCDGMVSNVHLRSYRHFNKKNKQKYFRFQIFFFLPCHVLMFLVFPSRYRR